jgi:hypothetical protein
MGRLHFRDDHAEQEYNEFMRSMREDDAATGESGP